MLCDKTNNVPSFGGGFEETNYVHRVIAVTITVPVARESEQAVLAALDELDLQCHLAHYVGTAVSSREILKGAVVKPGAYNI